ncbi:MAG: hypothetical protein AAGE59_29620 [Cyanobacteria bacterium P01_F01_bin.86]
MKHQISVERTEPLIPISLLQKLSDIASEQIAGGDGTCASCSVDNLLFENTELDTHKPLGYLQSSTKMEGGIGSGTVLTLNHNETLVRVIS